MTPREILRLELAYAKAVSAESRAVHALGERPSRRQLDRCWRLADRTNAAMRALQAARGYE